MIAVLMLAQAAAIPTEGQHPHPPAERGGYAYLLHLPKGYADEGKTRWPLMIFLHGSGERGGDLAKVKVHGPPAVADRDASFPFILLSPQLPADLQWEVAKLDALLDSAIKRLRVDPSRIYLTGLSLGGQASWRWATARPSRFAALVPVAGRREPIDACALKALPIWAFHGDRDDVVPMIDSVDMVASVRHCGGSPRLSVYPDTGHDSWTRTYADPALYLWFLSQRLPSKDEK